MSISTGGLMIIYCDEGFFSVVVVVVNQLNRLFACRMCRMRIRMLLSLHFFLFHFISFLCAYLFVSNVISGFAFRLLFNSVELKMTSLQMRVWMWRWQSDNISSSPDYYYYYLLLCVWRDYKFCPPFSTVDSDWCVGGW